MYISSFAISGYRSLKKVEITEMLPVCIFHGLNNSGKSNILSAIETIFRRKILVEDTTFSEVHEDAEVTKVEEVTKKLERVGSFWHGRISEFRDNFYLNGKDDITFSVSVFFTDDELAFLKDVLKHLKVGRKKFLTLVGRIKYVDDESADMILERVVFNNRYVVFEGDGGKKSFFPKVEKLSLQEKIACFDKLMNLLADGFALLPSDRYLTRERVGHEMAGGQKLTPKTFKKWLFNLSLSRSGHKTFEEIKDMFASKPFCYGKIGFSSDRDDIEIMVQEKNVRLPISRLVLCL